VRGCILQFRVHFFKIDNAAASSQSCTQAALLSYSHNLP
jgi:hypothetical protein